MSPLSASPHEFAPATPDELSRQVRENAMGARRPLIPAGGRTALSYGESMAEAGTPISMHRLSRVVDYPARDMTITVEAGMRLDALGLLLAEEKQRLPVDIAQSNRATIGGAIATNTSGPRRFRYGTLRNHVIGIAAVDGRGRLFRAGGRVVKNVAGYDVCKLLVGSLGTLAVISQVTLRLWPTMESTAFVWSTWSSYDALKTALNRLVGSATRPVAIEALDPTAAAEITVASLSSYPTEGPVLCIGFEGTRKEVEWQVEQVQAELAIDHPMNVVATREREADLIWDHLIEFQTVSEQPLTFQASVPPSQTIEFIEASARFDVSTQAHAGNGIIIGRLADEVTKVADAARIIQPLREMARQMRGSLTILHCEEAWKSEISVFGPPGNTWPVMKRLKRQFDPYEVLNRGRFLSGFAE